SLSSLIYYYSPYVLDSHFLHDALPIYRLLRRAGPPADRRRPGGRGPRPVRTVRHRPPVGPALPAALHRRATAGPVRPRPGQAAEDRKSTRLNSSHVKISYAVFCLKQKI